MTATVLDPAVLDDLDFEHQLPCEVDTCHDSPHPEPAVSVLAEDFGCCAHRRPICQEHRALVVVLKALHIPIRCKVHGAICCAHLAFTIGPLP